MYEKNLSEDLRLRLSSTDMDFLRQLSKSRSSSISEVIRSIIGEYRRGLETLSLLEKTIGIISAEKEGQLSNGDTKTDIDHKL